MKNRLTPKAVIATSIGSVLEIYDFVIYGFFASVLAALFFPKTDKTAGLLAVFGIFAVGYFARPFGALIFGHIADRLGRKRGLVLSVLSMAIPILLIGLLPTYVSIGITASILLLVFRVFQGLAIGGEFPTSIAFLGEHAQTHQRGVVTSWLYLGVNLGIVLASAVGAIISSVFTNVQLHDWAWRIPFLLGALLGYLGFYIRRRLLETPLYQALSDSDELAKSPVKQVFFESFWPLIRACGLVCLMASVISIIFLYMPVYLHVHLGLALSKALWLNTLNTIVFSLCIPVFAWLSDRFGRKPILSIATLLFILASYPIYTILMSGHLYTQVFGLLCLAVMSAIMVGPIPAALSEMFKTPYRVTGVGISYNVSFAIFGGLAPLIITRLIYVNHNLHAPAFYLIVAGIITLISLFFISEGSKRSLSE